MLSFLILLAIIGVALYLIPMEDRIKTLIVIIVVIASLLYLLHGFGYLPVSNFPAFKS